MRVGGVVVEADHEAAELLELGERAGKVLHQRHGHVLERARGRLGERAVERRAVAAGHDEAGRAERRARAQDGADVVRVGDLVEHDDGPARAARDQLGQRRLRQRLGLDQGTLVHGVGPEPAVEVLGQHPLVGHAPVGQGLLQATLGVVGEIELGDGAAADWRAPPPRRGCRRSAGGRLLQPGRAGGGCLDGGDAGAAWVRWRMGPAREGGESVDSAARHARPIAVDRE